MAELRDQSYGDGRLDARVEALLIENDGYRAAAALLGKHGWPKARIARRLGVSWITVHRWLDPAYAERGRRQRREYARRKRQEARDA
jgi:hypothetical protein